METGEVATTSAPGWAIAVAYLHYVVSDDHGYAARILDEAIERDGVGEVAGALDDVCRSLLDRIVFEPGTIDVHAAVDSIARHALDVAGPGHEGEREFRADTGVALDRLRALVVFLGSEGLPCTARTTVSGWSAAVRMQTLTLLTAGLAYVVAEDEGRDPLEVVAALSPPGEPEAARGTFSLTWRGPDGCPLLTGVVPPGYDAHITFLGAGTCSIRAIFARVAYLRTPRPNSGARRQLGAVTSSDAPS